MGMSASQARFLGLTARKADNEFEAQQICQQRANLAGEMDMVATAYSNAMSNKQLIFRYVDPSSSKATLTRLTYETITSTDIAEGLSMRIADAMGNVIVPNAFDPDAMRTTAYQTYQTALNNNCYELTTTTDGNTTKKLLDGVNFLSTYFLADKKDYKDTTNKILDADNDPIDISKLQNDIQYMNAAEFYDYWNEKGYKFENNSLEGANGVDSRLFTEDDDSAKQTYKTTTEKINEMENYHYTTDINCLNPDYLEEKLRSGEWTLQKVDTDTNRWEDTSYLNQVSIEDAMYTQDDSAAGAVYEEKTAFYKHQDQIMELRIKQLETEHNAIQTEMDSVKKVIEKNVESSFKTFG